MIEPYTGRRAKLRMAAYDLEWYPGSYEVRLVGCLDERGYRSYPSVEAFLTGELTSANRGRVYFAHAGGLADVQFLLAEILKNPRNGLRVAGSFSGSSLIRCTIHQGEHSWVFADSFWLFRDSLAKIGESVGLSKLGGVYQCPDAPACGHEPNHCVFHAPAAELRSYNERDCVILFEALKRFEREILELGGKLRQTIAATALILFRSRFLTETVPTDSRLNRLSREAYVASRCEVFKRSCGPANYYDINSSFPASMVGELPGGLESVSRQWHGQRTSIVDATVRIAHHIPPVPVRIKGRVFFPVGTFRRLMSGEDLHLVLESGGDVLSVHESWNFSPFFALGDYVREIYELRRASPDPFRRLVYKYLLNSLYGKFGEGEEKSELLIRPDKRPECSGSSKCRRACTCVVSISPGVFKARKIVEIAHAHLPLGCVITSRSRALLTRSLWKSAPIYCDTDSNITEGELETSDQLGAMKLEKTITRGEFLSPKLYRLNPGPEIRSKGFSRLSSLEFDALAQGEPVAIRRMKRIQENLGDGGIDPRDAEFFKRATSHFSEEELRARGLNPRLALRPKRCFEGSGSRPWDIGELEPAPGI